MFVVLCFVYIPFSSFYLVMKSLSFCLSPSRAVPNSKNDKKKVERLSNEKKTKSATDYRWVLFCYFIVQQFLC